MREHVPDTSPVPCAPQPMPRAPGRRLVCACACVCAWVLALPWAGAATAQEPAAQATAMVALDASARSTAVGPRLAALINAALQERGLVPRAQESAPALRLVVTPVSAQVAGLPALAEPSLALVGREPYLLAVKTDVAVRHLSEVRDGASDCGSDPSVATPAPGARELALHLGRGLNLEPRHVDFGGTQAAITGLAAGEIRFLLGSWSDMQPWLDRGEIRLLASTLPRRGGLWPQVGSVSETLPGFAAHMRWDLVATQALGAQVQAHWREQLARALGQPDVQQALASLGLMP